MTTPNAPTNGLLSPADTHCRHANGSVPAGETKPALPAPEVLERPHRRRFSAAYKLRIVQEADAAAEDRQVGALLRREGLYSSQLVAWRRLHAAGGLEALGQARGRKLADATAADVARLQRENAELTRRLTVAEEVIAIQKKVSSLLGIVLAQPED